MCELLFLYFDQSQLSVKSIKRSAATQRGKTGLTLWMFLEGHKEVEKLYGSLTQGEYSVLFMAASVADKWHRILLATIKDYVCKSSYDLQKQETFLFAFT